MSDPEDALSRSTDYLRERLPRSPAVMLVLGSGLGGVAESLEAAVRIPYESVPGFPRSTVAGHAGAVVAGEWAGVFVVALQGRFHLYEGWSAAEVAHPVRTLHALGARSMVLTNAAGAVRPGLPPGSLMTIADHINLMWRGPLEGPVLPGEERFPDMSEPYHSAFRRIAEEAATGLGIPLETGIYAAMTGPGYETPAEIRMLARLGADAVGMSTVPEVIAARALGVRVLGISCITNLAAGLGLEPLSHEEVMQVGEQVRDRLTGLLEVCVPRIAAASPEADR
jgi:purine-nucleoside phosphorylase